MSEHSIDLVPNLLVGHKSNGRSIYDREAKRELVRRCLQPGVSLAATALVTCLLSSDLNIFGDGRVGVSC